MSDEELIKAALLIEKEEGCIAWYKVSELAKQAENEKTRTLLEDITDKKINWKLFPENFLKYPIHLQHNHDTGMTEGAVHNYCNAVMWQYEGM